VSTIDVTEPVGAPADRVWAVIGDPVGMGGLTAECAEMAWTAGCSGPAVGARFRGRNRSGWRRWSTTCTIVRYEPGTEIAWDVSFGPLPIARWSYRVEPGDTAGSSVLTERVEDYRGRLLRTTAPLIRGTSDTDSRNRSNMEATLARVRQRAEA